MNLLVVIAMAAAAPRCYTMKEVKAKICWALCRQDGKDTGTYESETDSCLCGERKKFKEATEIRLRIYSEPEKVL